MSSLSNIIFFGVGAVVGAAASWYITRKIYMERSQMEIESVKEAFAGASPPATKKNELPHSDTPPIDTTSELQRQAAEKAKSKPDIIQYAAQMTKEDYHDYKDISTPGGVPMLPEEEDMLREEPFLIDEDRYGEIDDYEFEGMTYFADGVLTDENGDVVDEDEADEIISLDILRQFGESDKDMIWVRNNTLSHDYEIAKDLDNYADIKKNRMGG